jgi:hypothetical protein
MSLMSRLMAKMYKLPPAETYDIAVDKKLEIPMTDGVVLRADRYHPRNRENLPTLLIRTPYGRASYGIAMGAPMAERGFQVLVQSCRGSDDSGGELNAFRGNGRMAWRLSNGSRSKPGSMAGLGCVVPVIWVLPSGHWLAMPGLS